MYQQPSAIRLQLPWVCVCEKCVLEMVLNVIPNAPQTKTLREGRLYMMESTELEAIDWHKWTNII